MDEALIGLEKIFYSAISKRDFFVPMLHIELS